MSSTHSSCGLNALTARGRNSRGRLKAHRKKQMAVPSLVQLYSESGSTVLFHASAPLPTRFKKISSRFFCSSARCRMPRSLENSSRPARRISFSLPVFKYNFPCSKTAGNFAPFKIDSARLSSVVRRKMRERLCS